MQDDRVFQYGGEFPFPGIGQFGRIPVLHVPTQVRQQFVLVHDPVQHILVVEADAFRIGVIIVLAQLRHLVRPPVAQVDEHDARVKIRIAFGVLQDAVTFVFVASHVFHHHGAFPGQGGVPQAADAAPYHNVAIQIEHAADVFGQDVGKQTPVIGGQGDASV